jgi:hypothetical protein
MFRLDAQGALLWDRSYGGNLFVAATAFDTAPNGDLLLAGVFFDASDSDSLVVRLMPGGRGPTSCDLASATDPNVWSDALVVDAVSLDPVPTAHDALDIAAGSTSADTGTYLCPPGIPGATFQRPDGR